MKKLLSILTWILILIAVSKGQNYQLIWSDDFNDTSVDLNKWTFEIGNNNGWGNNELEYYTNRKENAYIENGILIIKAIKENYGGKSYTSARMKTQGKFSVKYGKIEARIKLPYGKGIWPAFWTLGDAISFLGWPKCGEIDIMEMVGGGTSGDKTVYGTAHWDNNGHAQYGLSYRLATGNFSDAFHVFSIEWDSQKIIWKVDGSQFCRIDLNASLNALREPHFLLLNLAVGGNWPGNPDNTTVFPQTMAVDYVNVYQLSTDIEQESRVIDDFSLEQNYPNPFNPSTVISYKVKAANNISLKVYDILGREVATLVNEFQNPGTYKSQFSIRDLSEGNEVSQLSNGVYFYQLRAGKYIETKKLVIMK